MGAIARRVKNHDVPARYDPTQVPIREYKTASKNTYFRKYLQDISILEDQENSYYAGILSTMSVSCVGTIPLIMGNHPVPVVNDLVEDKFRTWAIYNGIGKSLRQIRRGAARTGIGIGIPYAKKNSKDRVSLAIRAVSSTRLMNPRDAGLEERIYNGIQYDENWDPINIFIKEDGKDDPTEYEVKKILFWFKEKAEETPIGIPECAPAFCLFPSVKRYMEAIVRAEEFKACIPMAMELDPNVYAPDADMGTPEGKMKYEPGMIPTLPPGAKLTGLNIPPQGQERIQFIKLVISAAARCVNMPMNVALGDSSGHNMATAAIDVQPWENEVKVDRSDYEPVVRQAIGLWYDRAVLLQDYLIPQARNNFTYQLNYDVTFEHPDPNKRASARAQDLISGSTTLTKVYTDQGLNARRELDREARTLGIPREQLNEMIISARVNAPKIVEANYIEAIGDTTVEDN